MSAPLLAAFAAHAAAAPSRAALGDGVTTLSRGELLARVEALAGRLHADGVATLALAADNGPAWALVALAARHAGLTLLPLPPFFSDEQTGSALAAAGPDALLTDAPDRFRRWCAHGPADEAAGLAWLTPRARPRRHAGCALLTFTSGSTGRPKGIRLPAATLDAVSTSLASVTDTGDDERHLVTLPLAVLLEQVAGLERVLRAGGAVCAPPLAEVGARGSSALDAPALYDALVRTGATSAIFVPGSLLALVEHMERHGLGAPASCRFLGVGGAPVPATTLQRARRLGLPVSEGYGLTEAGSVVALSVPGSTREGSVGRPLPHLRVTIEPAPSPDAVDGSPASPAGGTRGGRTRRATPTGEIVLTGPLLLGELDGDDGHHPAPPRRLATGDLGHLDGDGFLYVTGRAKNLFVTSFGRNVSPEWVERRLLEARGLHQAVVLGEGLPRPVAVLVAAPFAERASVERDVERLCATLPEHARPARWLFTGPLTPAAGFWTATGRPRRAAIAAAFLPLLLEPGAPDVACSPSVPSPPRRIPAP